MNNNLDSYYIFYMVAKSGSISKAAENLYISQPAVTWHIKNLESSLETTLFIRTKKGTSLTEEGKIFLEYIEKGMSAFENGRNALTNLKKLDSGILRIGASTTVSKYVLFPYLEKFHDQYPNIDIRIVNALTKELLKELRNGNLDLLLLNLPMAETKDLITQKIMDVQDIFVGNKKYYDLTNGKINLGELKKYPLIFQKSPSNTRKYLDDYLKQNKIELIPKMEIVSYNLIMDFIKSGFGIGYATKEFVIDELKKKNLYEIKVAPSVPKRYIGAVTLKQTIPNYSAKKLLELMTK